MRILPPTIAIALVASFGLASAAPRPAHGPVAGLLASVKSGRLAEELAVKVSKAQIQLGSGTLVIEDGVLVPASPINGRTLEVAFVGEAWFRFSTTDRIESGQLELFTGDAAFLTRVNHMLLVSGNETHFQKLLSGERTSGPLVQEAIKLYKIWLETAERQGFSADIAMVKALLDDPMYLEYFAAWCQSPDQGDFYYIFEPSDSEPLTLGQFVPLDMKGLDSWQQRRVKDFMRMYKVFGRFASFSAEHPGYWDTWVSTGSKATHVSPVEVEHYNIDLYVNPNVELDAKGSARIKLRAGETAVRMIDFELYAGVKVTGVSGPKDEPLDFIRRDQTLCVFLPEALPPGDAAEIRIEYEGDLVEVLVPNESYALLSTQTWYPTIAQSHAATYDVTLRRPKRLALLASGQVMESGVEGDRAWERRVLDQPTAGFTFEVGRFDVVKEQAGHVALTFGFQGGDSDPTKEQEQRAKVIDTVKKTFLFFEERFGPYPLDYLTVATVDRGFSQGFLSMLTLAIAALQVPDDEDTPLWRARTQDQTMLTIAHEISHQWWGNSVGWASYHDQWLSESLASYSALLYGMNTAESRPAFLARNALDWRPALMARTVEGRTVASLGPITLGYRLNSSKSDDGYEAITYKKGEVVLRMLARRLGEERFTKALGELAKAFAGRTIDTAIFLKAIERMSSENLQAFADRFIYGTGIPEVYYRYSFKPSEEGKGWLIQGKARVIAGRIETFKVTEDAGRFKVDRYVKREDGPPPSNLIVPFQVIVTPPEMVKEGIKGTVQRSRGFGGRVVLVGNETPFEFTVPEKPERLELDQLGEVLARFHDEAWNPKGALSNQAQDLEASGDIASAEKLLRQALESPLHSERAIAWLSSDDKREKARFREDEEAAEKDQNSRIHTLLARYLVDRGEFDAAENEMLAAQKLLDKPESEAGWRDRRILRSRIDLARGDSETACSRLKKGPTFPWLGSEGYALLAIAATEAGHPRIAEEALNEAEARGVDVRALRNARLPVAGSAKP